MVVLLAICLGINGASPALSCPPLSEGSHWFLFVVSAYFLGHAVQAIGGRLITRSSMRRHFAKHMNSAVRQLLGASLKHFHIAAESPTAQVDVLDALKIEFPDREIFIARQGFFRGTAISFGLLSFVLLFQAILGKTTVAFGLQVDSHLAAIVSPGVGICAWLFYCRCRDFVAHELEHAVAAALKRMPGC